MRDIVLKAKLLASQEGHKSRKLEKKEAYEAIERPKEALSSPTEPFWPLIVPYKIEVSSYSSIGRLALDQCSHKQVVC